MQIRMVQHSRAQLNASDDPLEVVEQKEDPDHEVHWKILGNHWWNTPLGYLADCQRFRHLTHNCECMSEGGLEVWSYKSQKIQILTEKTKNLWLIKSLRPHSSPDLNPLNYFVWSYVENITNRTSHNTKASLIAAIHRVFAELPPVLVEKACSQFWIRIEAVIEAEGGYIELISGLLHNWVTWIDYFNKSFKIKLQRFFL